MEYNHQPCIFPFQEVYRECNLRNVCEETSGHGCDEHEDDCDKVVECNPVEVCNNVIRTIYRPVCTRE